MFKTIRITLLILILALVAGATWQTKRRIAQWDVPLRAHALNQAVKYFLRPG